MKKIDLHTHTIPTVSDSDFEFSLPKVKEYVEKLELDAIAITNHNTFDSKQYFEIRNSLTITVFPGIEVDLEGGHILVITDPNEFEISDFEQRCNKVSSLIRTSEDTLSIEEFNEIFPDLSKYILIPHNDKKPNIKQETIDALKPHITSGEVASVSKFKRAVKNEDGLVPVIFSDIRFKAQLTNFPSRQTYIDLNDISLSGIKSCLCDRSKISLTKESGNDFFQATDDGLVLSTGLTIILGERSSGKSVTLNKISASSGNAKYIKQFSLLHNDEQQFNDTNNARLSLVRHNFLGEFRKVVEKTVQVDLEKNHIEIDNYLDSLKKFASENEKKDLYSKCVIFSENAFVINDLSNLDKVIKAVETLIKNNEYQDIIQKHLETKQLKSLAIELNQKAFDSNVENNKKNWINSLTSDITRELRIKTTGSVIEDLDFYKIALDEVRVNKFNEVVSELKISRDIHREELGKFSVVTSTKIIERASDLQKIGRDKKTYSTAFSHYNTSAYQYLLKLKELGVEDANLFNFFIKIESVTLNKDGFIVSGGERSEFNLIHEIQDATKYDLLLIDEPESSFDNNFLNKEINSIIKHISTLMPVVVVTHNSTVGASIKPNYLAITKKSIEDGEFIYRTYTGYPSDKELISSDGNKIENYKTLLSCLEAGLDAYNERKEQAYDILKN
ncbi:PHP domain-containing protein [Tenacibaculum maritimum]|uniref:PHP domain-containing protein n=1 Tax=Tenacibaculum maritimum TaxID=107401 RepID=UPI0010A44B1A|nr:PHP domain-containing protein [Tenacibaculum maritimum]QCD61600.1 histidinol-phosphatase [Tenacibaculum maritimum]